jgi:protein-S-isoprenylcysteine O-methyltransferase Ste14
LAAIGSLGSEALLAAAAAHVVCRLTYLLWIGFTLRASLSRRQEAAGHRRRWLAFRRKASAILRLDAVTFVAVCLASAGSPALDLPYPYLLVPGILLVLAGVAAKASAYRVVGEKGYYWYNFFCPDEEISYARVGIYRYLDNPMYGPGYLHAFGLALLLRSGWGILVALFDWAVVWTFYFLFERPHTRLAAARLAPPEDGRRPGSERSPSLKIE